MLLKDASERGPWASLLHNGYHLLQKKQYKGAFLNYLESSYLGTMFGHANAAMILEKFKPFKTEDLIYVEIDQIMRSDVIFQFLEKNRPNLIPKDLFKYHFDDYMQLLSKNGYHTLKVLSSESDKQNLQYYKYLSFRLY